MTPDATMDNLTKQLEKCTLEQCTIQQPSATQMFLNNLPKNTSVALLTVPIEALAIDRVKTRMQNLNAKPTSYYKVGQLKKFKLVDGWRERTAYCLLGNFATVVGRQYLGDSYGGLALTSLCKQVILPLSLLSNASQLGYSAKQTKEYINKDLREPVAHLGFLARNFFSNIGLAIGLDARSRYYNLTHNANQAQYVGFGVSLAATSIFNAAIKTWFIVGDYPWKVRVLSGLRLPALMMTAARESVSTYLQYSSTPKLGKDQD